MPSIASEKSWLSLRTLLAVTGAVIGLSVLAIGLAIVQLRTDAIDAAYEDSDNLAAVLADQIGRTIKPIDDLLLDLTQRRIAAADIHPTFGTGAVHADLNRRFRALSQATVISITDVNGDLVNWTREWPPRPLNFGSREFYTALKNDADCGLHISAPVVGRMSGLKIVFFSRRIHAPDGSFAGVATVGVPLDYFRHVYESIGTLADRSFLLLRQDGTVLALVPDDVLEVGQKMPAGSPWYDAARKGGGFHRAPGNVDGRERLVATRQVAGRPLLVTLAITEAAALATWKNRAGWIVFGSLLALLCCAVLLRSLAGKSRALEQTSHQLDAALNNMSYGLCMFDRDGRLMVHNDRYLEMYGLSGDQARPGTPLRELLRRRAAVGTLCSDVDAYVAEIGGALTGRRAAQVTTELSDGRVISVLNDRLADGGWVAVHEDITERTRAEQRIAHMARHDALTDLANRPHFRERMDEAFDRLAASGHRFAVLIFDVDLFKSVNDSLGHSGGDALLEQVAQRLRGAIGACDTAGRIGGDEFAVIQVETDEDDPRAAAADLAGRLLEQIRAPYDIDGQRVVIGISIGIAIAPEDGAEPSQILRNADLALYRAKSDGRGCFRFFEPAMDADARLHRIFEFELREALVRGEFELHYQPIVDITSGRPCAVEALVRWRHPRHGLIPPDKFIPVAEEIGLIVPLGAWILKTACATAAAWPGDVRLAVNLSAVQVRSGDLPEVVRAALADSGLPAARLELEITESVLLQKDQGGLAVLHELAALGARIVLDDFGTGYSSLSYLQLFPFSKIKIDKSFVAELSNRSDCAAIVCTVLNLAKALDMATTAEGVETVEQLVLLRAAGCSEAQGWLFGRPAPADQLVFDAPLRRRAAV